MMSSIRLLIDRSTTTTLGVSRNLVFRLSSNDRTSARDITKFTSPRTTNAFNSHGITRHRMTIREVERLEQPNSALLRCGFPDEGRPIQHDGNRFGSILTIGDRVDEESIAICDDIVI